MAVAAGITAWNAVIARKLLEETQRTREAQLAPTVVARLAIDHNSKEVGLGYLIVENLGPGVALGVRLSIEDVDDYEIIERRRVRDLTPFLTSRDMIPGQKYRGLIIHRKRNALPGEWYPKRDFPVVVTCKDMLGKTHRWQYILPQDPNDGYLDIGYSVKSTTRQPNLMDVANEIVALREYLERRDL